MTKPSALLVTALLCISTKGHCGGTEGFLSIEDYFGVARIADLALAQDGSKIVYSLERRDIEENRIKKRIVIQPTSPQLGPVYIEEIQGGEQFSWIPNKGELAFIMEKDGLNQIFSLNVTKRTILQLTRSKASIHSFWFSPDGESIAWLSDRIRSPTTDPIFMRMAEGSSGVVVPAMSTSLFHFLSDYYPDLAITYENELWLRKIGDEPIRIEVPGYVRRVNWSSDSQYLTIELLENIGPNKAKGSHLISLGLFDLSKREFRLIAKARRNGRNNSVVWFEGGEWIPGTHRFLVQRHSRIHPWIGNRFPSLAVIGLENWATRSTPVSWHQIEVGPETKFFPISDDTILVANIVDGVRTVYSWNLNDLSNTPLFNIRGDISKASFASDFDSAAFVNESFGAPPEILFSEDGGNIRQISNVNGDLAHKLTPMVRKLSWESTSGTTAYGWLMLPTIGGYEGTRTDPYPMITYVHGGPASPITNGYARQLLRWPYPFEVLAQSGIAIFLPNYRGTASYGLDYITVEHVDKEPLEDILSGIRHLVDLGIADEDCLGIAGHSHGVWLGSLAMTKHRDFYVASFAEGTANYMVNYAMMTASLNHRVHDPIFFDGRSLYENPSRGIEISAVYHFQGLDTAVLFEAGFKSLAVAMLDHQKAALFFGMPSEFVVYPRTEHAVTEPLLQYEVANRNLDWFRFWLQGYEDRSPEKAGQYARWRKMRDADARCRHARVE